MDNKELHDNFLKDFEELLKKYDAYFTIDFEPDGWSHRDIPVINFNWQDERSYSEFRLPSCIG